MQTAPICNIQKFSIHDGPGIRTTVFFAGCPLRCAWCANPESQRYPTANEWATAQIKEMSLEDVLTECLQDKAFYKESSGGVTFSGGEPLLHEPFAAKLANALHKKHVDIAIETTGCVSAETFAHAMKWVDLFLFDVKHYQSDAHQRGTGVAHDLILHNLKQALAAQANLLTRIPVIPHFNAEVNDAQGFSRLFLELGIDRVQLLPFHQMGENKYEKLNRAYTYKDELPLHEEDLKDYQQTFIKAGIDAFF